MKPFSITTNVCASDDHRVKHTVPSWLRSFGSELTSISIIIDKTPPTGRIAQLHGGGSLDRLETELQKLTRLDSRIISINLPMVDNLRPTLATWFGNDTPFRCQAGTPIAAFVYAIDVAPSEAIVMRCDCDMIFHHSGFVSAAAQWLDENPSGLVEPFPIGKALGEQRVSTRAILLRPREFAQSNLPMKAHRVDWLRQLHRRLINRSTFIALESMLDREKSDGRIQFHTLPDNFGSSLHIAARADFLESRISEVVNRFENGDIPDLQRTAGRNYYPIAWNGKNH